MNKFTLVAIILGLFLVAYVQADGDQSANIAAKATAKAMDGVKKAAQKGADGVGKVADDVTVRVERFTAPAAHQPQQHNIALSAIQGAGRLARNITLEAGNFVGAIGRAGIRLGTTIPAALYGTVRETAARIASPRHLSKGNSSVESSEKSEGKNNDEAPKDDQNHASAENAAAPSELKKTD